MASSILFNGAVLVKPGGATSVNAQAFAQSGLAGLGVVGLIGECTGGMPNALQVFTDPGSALASLRDGPLADAARIAFQPGNDTRVPGGAQTLVCIRTDQSVQASQVFNESVVALTTGSGTGTISSVAGPGTWEQAALTIASAAGLPSGVEYTAQQPGPNGNKITVNYLAPSGALSVAVSVNAITVQLAAGGSTNTAIAAAVNAYPAASALVSAMAVGTGTDTNSVLVAAQYLTGGANAGVYNPPVNTVLAQIVTGGTAGTATFVISTDHGNTYTATPVLTSATSPSLILNGELSLTFNGTFTATNVYTITIYPVFKLTSDDWGDQTNGVTATLSEGPNGGRLIQLQFIDQLLGKTTTEVSTELGGTAEFSLVYTGNATAATVTINGTNLVTTLTPAVLNPDGTQDLNIQLSSYASLAALVAFINAQPGYTAVIITQTPYALNGTNLDYVGSSTTVTSLTVLPNATLPVVSTAGFPSTGILTVLSNAGLQTLAYTGITATSFTGVSGGTGSAAIGAVVAGGGVSILTTPLSLYAKQFRLIAWVNANSSLASASIPSTAIPPVFQGAPDALDSLTSGPPLYALLGGCQGISLNSDFQNAFNEMGTLLVDEVVACMSYDLVNDGTHTVPTAPLPYANPPIDSFHSTASGLLPSTATYLSVSAQSDAHSAFFSSTAGKMERQSYQGIGGPLTTQTFALVPSGHQLQATITNVIQAASLINDFNLCLTCQYPTLPDRYSNPEVFPAWMMAVIAAGMRAGSALGEPLTWKYLRIVGLAQDPSWNTVDNGAQMILGGVMIAEIPGAGGFRWVSGVTTYTQSNNDAYQKESVVLAWKEVAYDSRTYLENLFTGRKLTPVNVDAFESQVEYILGQERKAGLIVDSVFPDGSTLLAYRKITVGGSTDSIQWTAEVSPVDGIDFELGSIFLVPATISA